MWSTSVVSPRWNMAQHRQEEGALQSQPAMHLNVWGMSPHIGDLSCDTTGVKRSLLEPRPSHSRQKQIRWDILCQLQPVLNPCEWAFWKSAIIKVLLNFPWMGFHPAEIRWHQTGGAALQEAMSQMTWLLVWFKVLFCAVSVCDKPRPELYNTSMIPALI